MQHLFQTEQQELMWKANCAMFHLQKQHTNAFWNVKNVVVSSKHITKEDINNVIREGCDKYQIYYYVYICKLSNIQSQLSKIQSD